MTGTLLTLAPRSLELALLVRIALDAEQVGATRIQLAADQVDPLGAVAALRASTGLLISADSGGPFDTVADLLSTDGQVSAAGRSVLLEFAPDAALDAAGVVAGVADRIRTSTLPVSVSCHGPASMPGLLAALAAGGHVRVGTLGDQAAGPREDVTLIGRAAGIARLVGRPALTALQTRTLLGLLADGSDRAG